MRQEMANLQQSIWDFSQLL